MKIAIGTDDGKTIRKGHFGESRLYQVYTVLNGQIRGCEDRENSAKTQEAYSHHGQSQKIAELLKDCDIFLGRSMGRASMKKLVARHVDCILTDYEDIRESLERFLLGVDQGFRFFDGDSGTLRPCRERNMVFKKS